MPFGIWHMQVDYSDYNYKVTWTLYITCSVVCKAEQVYTLRLKVRRSRESRAPVTWQLHDLRILKREKLRLR